MRRRFAIPVVICVLVLGGCGGGGVKISSAPSSFDDVTLAGDLLSTQTAALHQALPGSWERVGSSSVSLQGCVGWSVGRAGMTADASSAPYAYRHLLGLRVASLLYSDEASAKRALTVIATVATRSCLARQLMQGLRARHYLLGRARSSISKVPGTGSEARALQIAVPASGAGRRYTWRYEAVAVRQGRRIDLLGTTSTAAKLFSDRHMAAALARVTAVAQRYLQTGEVAGAGAASG